MVVIVVMVMVVVVIMVMVVVVVMVMVMVVVMVVVVTMIVIPMHVIVFMDITSQIMSMPLHLLDHIDLRMPMRINLDRLPVSFFNTLRTADPPRGHVCLDPCASCPSTCPPQEQREQPAWPAARPPCPVISTLTILKPPGISPENPT